MCVCECVCYHTCQCNVRRFPRIGILLNKKKNLKRRCDILVVVAVDVFVFAAVVVVELPLTSEDDFRSARAVRVSRTS